MNAKTAMVLASAQCVMAPGLMKVANAAAVSESKIARNVMELEKNSD